MAVCTGAVQLPGSGWAGVVVLVLLAAASLFVLRGRPAFSPLLVLPPALIVLAAVSIPFLSNERLGPIGVTFNDDLAPHYAWSEALRSGNDRLFDTIIPGYPVGAHSLAAVFAALFGSDVNGPFTALLLSTPILTAITATSMLRHLSLARRLVGAVVVGLPYLAMGYFAQGAFKEPMQGLFVLAFALGIRELAGIGLASPLRIVPLAVLAAGGVSVYGFPGIYHSIAIAGAIGALWFLLHGRRAWGSALRRGAAAAAVGLGLVLLLVLPQLSRLLEFSPVDAAFADKSNPFGGNYVGDLSGFQVFGIWDSWDFRSIPPSVFHAGVLSGLAALAAAYGALWLLRRGEFELVVGAAIALAIYAVAHEREVPYISGKVLVMASPIVALVCIYPLVASTERWDLPPLRRLAFAVAAAGFAVLALSSSFTVLRHTRVGPLDHAREFAAFRPIVRDEPTLFLGQDAFAPWEMGVPNLSVMLLYGVQGEIVPELRPGKPLIESPLDFDSVTSASLDRFRYTVTGRTAFASHAPENWRRVKTTRSFALWERIGPGMPRDVVPAEGPNPAATLDCTTPEGRAIARRGGVAATRPIPHSAPSLAWASPAGPIPFDGSQYAVVSAGVTVSQVLDLPVGRWDISFQHVSHVPLDVSAGDLETTLPANLNRRGPYWSVGTITSSGGPVRVTVTPKAPRLDLGDWVAVIGNLIATRVGPDGLPLERVVPIREACGRYVDWFRTR